MIKKILKVLGILLVLLLAAIVVLPIIFKDDIIAKAKEEINNNVNAKVDFGDFDLSLISSFPDFTFSIEDISVIGIDEFDGVKLADIGEINLVVDLMSVINGETIQIKVIEIMSPEMNVIVTQEGKANYDIAKASEGEVEEELEVEEEEETPAEEGETSFQMKLEKLEIASANITYDDRQGDMYAGLENFNFLLSGDFSADLTDILADMSIDGITYKMDGVPYLNKAEIEMHAELAADMANSKYSFTENSFRINQLVLGFDGWVQMLENDAMDMDVTFNTKQTSFKSILSLVPAVYTRDFESVQTNGQLALSGFAKGKMEGENYPGFGLDLSVKDANFKYPDLPKSVDDIQIAVNVQSPGGDLDNMVIEVATFHVELAGNPFDMGVLIKTPMSDPFLKASFDGHLDLSSIKDVIPLEQGDEVNGLIDMDIALEGNQSTIDEERYEDFEAKGNLVVSSMVYTSSELPYTVSIEKIDVEFAPKYVTLRQMDMMVGRSDFSARGQVERFIPYVFDEEAVLLARLELKSNLIDATEFMEEEEEGAAAGAEAAESSEASGEESEEEPMEVVEIPGNIDFELASSIGKIHLEDFDIDNFKGKVIMRDRKMTLDNTVMNLLNGRLAASGYYETTSPNRPTFDFDMAVEKFDINSTVTTFNTVEKMVPLFKKSEGSYSTKFEIKGVFDDKMEVIGESLHGKGVLQTHKVGLKGFSPLELAADKLKREDLRNPRLDDMNITFTIEGGKMFMDPFEVKTGNITTVLSGWTAFDQTIEYDMNMAIPRDEFGGAANQAAAQLLTALQQKTGQNISLPEIVNITGKITGTADDPKIALDLPKFGGGGQKDMKKQLEEELAKKRKELEDKARQEAERLKKEAEEKARKEAERLKKEAEQKAKQEAERLKKQAEEEAKKRLEEEKRKQEEAAKKKMEEEAKKKLKGLFK